MRTVQTFEVGDFVKIVEHSYFWSKLSSISGTEIYVVLDKIRGLTEVYYVLGHSLTLKKVSYNGGEVHGSALIKA